MACLSLQDNTERQQRPTRYRPMAFWTLTACSCAPALPISYGNYMQMLQMQIHLSGILAVRSWFHISYDMPIINGHMLAAVERYTRQIKSCTKEAMKYCHTLLAGAFWLELQLMACFSALTSPGVEGTTAMYHCNVSAHIHGTMMVALVTGRNTLIGRKALRKISSWGMTQVRVGNHSALASIPASSTDLQTIQHPLSLFKVQRFLGR